MAALPETVEDLSAPADSAGISTPTVEKDSRLAVSTAGQTTGAGGKKKKKGKK
jgi:hypothetical protein